MSEKKLVNINSNEFEMIVEESQSFFSKGLDIVVFLNKKTNRKLYAKAVKMAKEGIVLQPLTATEMKEFSIEESLSQTSYNSDGTFDLDIQESVSESEPIVKPIAQFNSRDPESMRKAAKLATEIADKLENQNPENSGIQAAKEVLKDMQENLSVELTALGVDTNPEDLKTKTDIDRAVSTVKKMRELKQEIKAKTPTSQSTPAGCVPLSSQTPARTQNEGYGDVKSMIDDVNRNPDKSVRNALLSKVLKGSRNSQVDLEYHDKKVDPASVMTTDLGEGLLLSKKPDPYGLKHKFREKKLRERAAIGDQQAQNILDSGEF